MKSVIAPLMIVSYALSFTPAIASMDVRDGSSEYIEVTRQPNNRVAFRFCDSSKKKCEQLGARSYDLNDLRRQRDEEERDVTKAIAGKWAAATLATATGVALIIVSVGTATPAVVSAATSLYYAGSTVFVLVFEAGLLGYGPEIRRALDDDFQRAQADTVSEKVILDADVRTPSVRQFADRLREVFAKMD